MEDMVGYKDKVYEDIVDRLFAAGALSWCHGFIEKYSPPEFEVKRVVIGRKPECDFLRDIGAKWHTGDCEFLLLRPVSLERDDTAALAHELLRLADPAEDLRPGKGLFELDMSVSYPWLSDEGIVHGSTYVGDITEEAAAAVHGSALCHIATHAIDSIWDTFWTLDVDDCIDENTSRDVCNHILRGHERIELTPGSYNADLRNDSTAGFYALLPRGNEAICERQRQLSRVARDIASIWHGACKIAEGNGAAKRFNKSHSTIVVGDEDGPTRDDIERRFREIAEVISIDPMLDAYYAGVPVEDIVA